MDLWSPVNLAYFTNRYGSASFTFIMTEVEHLRRLGHTVHTFSVRYPGSDEAVSDQVRREQENTEYFLEPGSLRANLARIALAVLRSLLSSPGRFAGAVMLAHRTSAPGFRARFRQAAYFILACHLGQRMKAKGIDHLHNHLGSSSATIAMLASALTSIPYSLTIHGGWIFFEPRLWALGEKIARSSFTACISSFCRSQCMLFAPLDAWHRLEIVRCAVDERFLSGALSPLPETPAFVCVGRLSAEKGHLVLVEAACRLVAEGTRFSLTLVGDGPMRPEIERRITELRLGGVVHVTGMVGADEVRHHLDSARIFVLASLTEGLPVSIMEALARGRPVIATNVGAIQELVIHGQTGWLVGAGSGESLADAMREALRAPTERLTQMGRRGAALVADRHGAADEVLKLERLMRSSVARGSRP